MNPRLAGFLLDRGVTNFQDWENGCPTFFVNSKSGSCAGDGLWPTQELSANALWTLGDAAKAQRHVVRVLHRLHWFCTHHPFHSFGLSHPSGEALEGRRRRDLTYSLTRDYGRHQTGEEGKWDR